MFGADVELDWELMLRGIVLLEVCNAEIEVVTPFGPVILRKATRMPAMTMMAMITMTITAVPIPGFLRPPKLSGSRSFLTGLKQLRIGAQCR